MKTFPKFNFLFEPPDRLTRLGRYFLLIASLRLKEEKRRKGKEGERRTFLVGQRHLLSLVTIHPSCLYSVTRSRSSEKGGTISVAGAIVSHLLWCRLYWTRSLSMDALHYFGVRAVHIVHCEAICSNDWMESHILFVHKDLTKIYFLRIKKRAVRYIGCGASQCLRQGKAIRLTLSQQLWGWRTLVGPPGVSFLLPITMEVNAEFSISKCIFANNS